MMSKKFPCLAKADLTFTIQWANSADDKMMIFFSPRREALSFNTREIIFIKCQILFEKLGKYLKMLSEMIILAKTSNSSCMSGTVGP